MTVLAAPLLHEHTDWFAAEIARDPAANVFLQALLERSRTAEIASPAGRMVGCFRDGRPVAAYWLGSTIVPLSGGPETNRMMAAILNHEGRRPSSFVGPAEPVLDLTSRLNWGAPRDRRPNQPLLSALAPPTVVPDPLVRQFSPYEAEVVFPASVAMYEEEVGHSPLEGGNAGYRNRVEGLIASGLSLGYTARTGPTGEPMPMWPNRMSDEQVVFKADIGIGSGTSVQVQGVWVHPEYRGRGVASRAMAATTALIRRRFAPIVTLYANSHNAPALRAYAKAGFVPVGTFATVTY